MEYGILGPYCNGSALAGPLLSRIPSPAVATGFTIAVDQFFWERPIALSFLLTCDTNDQARTGILSFKDADGVIVAQSAIQQLDSPSTALQLSFLGSFSGGPVAAGTTFIASMPPMFLQPEWTLSFDVLGIQAGDQISAIRWYRDRFLYGDLIDTPKP